MQTLVEDLTIYPRALKAANDDSAIAAPVSDKAERPRAFGWDPYEVWRTRIKALQGSAGRNPRVG